MSLSEYSSALEYFCQAGLVVNCFRDSRKFWQKGNDLPSFAYVLIYFVLEREDVCHKDGF